MARIRNPPASSASNARKRQWESISPAHSPKRIQHDIRSIEPMYDREYSPSKKVHWGHGSRIISGPRITDPERRSQSPTRSALRNTASEHEDCGHSDDVFDLPGPRNQLSEELQAAIRNESIRKPTSPKKRAHDSRSLTPGVGTLSNARSSKKGQAKPKVEASMSDDVSICTQLDELKTLIGDFAEAFPSRPKKATSDVLSYLMQPQNEQLVRYIGCIAMGSGKGAEGWQELLTFDVGRRVVVWGVLGKALKENVFDDLYFGAWPELESKLGRMEQDQVRQDGFYRQRSRSDEIVKQEAGKSRATRNEIYTRAAVRTTIALEDLLLPLRELSEKGEASWRANDMHHQFFKIVATAGEVARAMRRSRDVIYYWPPTLKDEEFEPARMECLNIGEMIRQSPYDRQTIGGRERAVLREGRGEESQAIVQVVCFPGVQAFRQGGGELAKKQLAAESMGRTANDDDAPPDVLAVRRKVTNRYGVEYTGNEGFRTRVISKGVVFLKWGQQRLLTKEAGTSIHVDAVQAGKMDRYREDAEGHVELFQLFQERTASARQSPVKLTSPPQRSPSLVERVTSFVWSQPEREEEEEVSPEIANFKEMHAQRMAEKQRGRATVPANPRGRKGSGRY